jgi:hypothetical protein
MIEPHKSGSEGESAGMQAKYESNEIAKPD